MMRIGFVLALSALLVAACQSGEGGDLIGGEGAPQQAQLPQINFKLPPPPSFQKDHAPETYPDGSYSVYGVRKGMEKTLNQAARVKGFVLEVYECPTCPKGINCKACRKPHFYLSDRASGPKDQALLVVDYPKENPETRKKLVFQVGAQYLVTGTFSKLSGSGFSSSNGLLVYTSSAPVVGPE